MASLSLRVTHECVFRTSKSGIEMMQQAQWQTGTQPRVRGERVKGEKCRSQAQMGVGPGQKLPAGRGIVVIQDGQCWLAPHMAPVLADC